MGLVWVQVSVLVEEDLGERELELLIVSTVGDHSRKVQPAHPDVAIVLDRERTDPLLARVPLPKPLEERMHQRRMPDDLPLQPLQKLPGIHETSYPLPVHLKFTAWRNQRPLQPFELSGFAGNSTENSVLRFSDYAV